MYYEQFDFNQIDNLTKGITYPHFATKVITFKRKHEKPMLTKSKSMSKVSKVIKDVPKSIKNR